MNPVVWDAEVLNRIRHLHLKARRAVVGWQHGGHRSLHTAANIEFVDYQEYTPGDSLRHVDWKVAARTDRLVIRRHEAETEVGVTLVLDASGDLGTGGDARPDLDHSKLGAAISMVATLAVFLEHRGDPVGLEVLGGEDVMWASIPPRTGTGHLARQIGVLAHLRAGGQAALDRGFERLGERLKRRSMAVVVSDLMEEPATWGPTLAALVQRGIDLRVVHLYDPDEWSMKHVDSALLFSPEGGDALAVDKAVARAAFQKVTETYVEEVRRWVVGHRGRHYLTPSTTPLEQVLTSVLRGSA